MAKSYLYGQVMHLGEAIRRRRMCRDFSEDPVPPETVDRLLDRARRAPSAGHTQGWAFLVLSGPEETDRFWEVAADPAEVPPGLRRAPVIVVPLCSEAAYLARYSEPDKQAHGLGDDARTWPTPFWVVDVSFATMLLLLGAVEEGLGALFFGLRGQPAAFRAAFGIPEEWQAIGAVALGRQSPDGPGPAGSGWRGRRSVEEVVHRRRW